MGLIKSMVNDKKRSESPEFFKSISIKVSKTPLGFQNLLRFPKPPQVSKTPLGFQNLLRFPKSPQVSKTPTGFQNLYMLPIPKDFN
jgi:hypothetical protein